MSAAVAGPRPSSYKWEILEGEGGELVNADKAEAIFRAPVLEDKEIELFVIRLTAQYAGQDPATEGPGGGHVGDRGEG